MVFEVSKRTYVDLISFDTVFKIKIVKFECTTKHSDLSSYFDSFYTGEYIGSQSERERERERERGREGEREKERIYITAREN